MIHTRKLNAQTSAQREAQKAFKDADTKIVISEYQRDQNALQANRERLKAERLAREAAPPEARSGQPRAAGGTRRPAHRSQSGT